MAMGTRKQREKQEDIWIAHTELASAPGHPFYQRLNELLEGEQLDQFVEERCAKFYTSPYGRPSLTPGIYIRSLLIGALGVWTRVLASHGMAASLARLRTRRIMSEIEHYEIPCYRQWRGPQARDMELGPSWLPHRCSGAEIRSRIV